MSRDRREWLAVGIVALVVFGVLGSMNNGARGPWNYLTGVALIMSIYAIFALGLSLQFGHGGLLNFGHVAFMGVGAYSVALVTMHFGATLVPRMEGVGALGLLTALLGAILAAGIALVPALLLSQRVLRRRTPRAQSLAAAGVALAAGIVAFAAMFPFDARTAPNGVVLLGIVVGVVGAALASLILGIPAIRLREDYLAIVTLGAAEIFRSFVANEEPLTRGTLGVIALQRPVAEWALASGWWQGVADAVKVRPVALAHATLALLVVAFVFLLLETLARSPWGRVLKAVREDDAVASSLGKNVTVYKLEVLMIGASLAAVAGILAA
ncbi:MAG TPA: branched-chain amino acid ABC transporter permease, partial [Candidatus Thermoplasmatota archaeon]|nr:branched-chain amino acid ABC transporter permease [Candidatus Thermoplasmatota archaeon]